MNAVLRDSDGKSEPVLFINQRQLLVYGQVDVQEIFRPYENLYLMEMAMAHYLPYLDEFKADIREKKFSFIVSDPLNIWPQDGRAPWGYENNVYVEYISLPILEYYLPIYMNKDMGIAIYAPNPDIEGLK